MSTADRSEIEPTRISELNRASVRDGKYVLYCMQQSQRARYNHALEFAIQMANELDVPVVVCFGIAASFPVANIRHYTFMLEGLKEVETELRKRGIQFIVRFGSPSEIALQLGSDASAVILDRGYLRLQRQWREKIAQDAPCAVFEIESDVVVPVDVVSDKAEYAARTIRPKITKLLPKYLKQLISKKPRHSSLKIEIRSEDLSDLHSLLRRLKLSDSPHSVSHYFKGGEIQAQERLKLFLKTKFMEYSEDRNHPALGCVSHMAMHLHFGQISALDIALQVQKMPKSFSRSKDVFLEELIVRRELAMNFVRYNDDYDSYAVLPRWAQATLEKHSEDERQFEYSEADFEEAKTHDIYWNACMNEMRETGYMHNYMRMYWGKKILEWSSSPQEAYRITIHLNNKYFLCGRDPNAFANVLWVFGLHDRPWGERPVYGTIRSMSAAGLERKTDIMAYVDQINGLLSTSGD